MFCVTTPPKCEKARFAVSHGYDNWLMIAQLVEHFTDIAEFMVRIPFKPEFFFSGFQFSQLLKLRTNSKDLSSI